MGWNRLYRYFCTAPKSECLLAMNKLILLTLTLALTSPVLSQDLIVKKLHSEVTRTIKKEIDDTTDWRWKRGGIVNVNVNQGTLRNWAAGGDKFSLAVNSYVNYFIFYRKGKQNWDNTIDFNFGMVQTTSLGNRKNDDRFDVLSKYGYKFDGKLYLTGLFNFRTQFFDGYNFSGNRGNFSSSFLSPAYALTSVGVDYKTKHFSAFVSPLTSRWVIVTNQFLSDKGSYGVPSGKHAINELGAFATLSYNKGFVKNVSYKGRLDLFANYREKPGNIDVLMTNFFSFKINKYFSASYNLDLIYDDDVKLFGETKDSPSLQLKSLIGLGFTMRFK